MTGIDVLVRRADPVRNLVSSDSARAQFVLDAVLAGTATRPHPVRPRRRAWVAALAAGAAAAVVVGTVLASRGAVVGGPGSQPGAGGFVQVTPWSEVHSAGPVQTPAPLSSAERASLASGHPLDPTSIDCYADASEDHRVDGIVATGGNPIEGCRSLMTRHSAGELPALSYPADSSVCVRAATGGLVVLPGHLSCASVGPVWAGSYTQEEQGVIAAWVRIDADQSVYTTCNSAADLTTRYGAVLSEVGLKDWTVAAGPMDGMTGNSCFAVLLLTRSTKRS